MNVLRAELVSAASTEVVAKATSVPVKTAKREREMFMVGLSDCRDFGE
jgi:hypothetical protein